MPGWLAGLTSQLSEHPVLQALLAALSTFILEDPTTVGCGLLVADGRMGLVTAFIGVSSGIALGDIGLYLIGRYFGPRVVTWGWISEPRLARARSWFHRNLVATIVLSRFIPGMRLPTYLGAGVLHAPLYRFVVVAVAASIVWTLLLLWLTVAIGEAILPALGRAKWPVALVALLLMLFLQRRAARKLESRNPEGDHPIVSSFEFWPPWLFYIPVGFYYAWLSIRFRGPLLPTIANPSIYSGGLIGESKSQILDLVPEPFRRFVAPYVVVDEITFERSVAAMRDAGLSYPVVAKPDVGQRGAGVRPLHGDDELRTYLQDFPEGERLMLQRMVGPAAHGATPEVSEAGVLYWRSPDSQEGRIFSITLKSFPRVVGDGERTLRQLIRDDARASHIADIYLKRHAGQAERVLAAGEVMPLVFAGNHCQGAIFRDGTDMATPELLRCLHGLACAMPEFYFGRFDIRFVDLQAFLRGEDLQIIEINGAGAEATHIWDATVRLDQAYATLFEQFRILFTIGAANRRRGHRPLGVVRFVREALAYRRLARSYPMTY